MTSHQTTSRNHFAAFDLLRVVAILFIVLFWHVRGYHDDALPLFLYPGRVLVNGMLAVLVFISGVLLSRYQFPGDSPWQFYRNRMLRIYPLFALALLLMWGCNLVKDEALLPSLLLSNMINGEPLLTLWFVTLIMLFYLVTPLLLWRYQRGRFAIIALLLTSAVFAAHLQLGWFDKRLAIYLPCYLLGLACGREASLHQLWRSWPLALAGALFAALTLAHSGPQPASALFGGDASQNLWASVIGGLLLIATYYWAAERLTPLVAGPVLAWFSYTSFALYLFHRPVFVLIDNWIQPATVATTWLWLAGVGGPMALLISWLLQRGSDRLFARR